MIGSQTYIERKARRGISIAEYSKILMTGCSSLRIYQFVASILNYFSVWNCVGETHLHQNKKIIWLYQNLKWQLFFWDNYLLNDNSVEELTTEWFICISTDIHLNVVERVWSPWKKEIRELKNAYLEKQKYIRIKNLDTPSHLYNILKSL